MFWKRKSIPILLIVGAALFVISGSAQAQSRASLYKRARSQRNLAATESLVISGALTDSSIKYRTKQKLREIRGQLDKATDALGEVMRILRSNRRLNRRQLYKVKQVLDFTGGYIVGVNVKLAALGLK